MMHKYNAVEEGIKSRDIISLRETVGSICYADRAFVSGEFDEVVSYVESKGVKLIENKLEGPLLVSKQKNEYTDDDFSKAVFELKKNFCSERIEDVKHIGMSLYGKQNKVLVKSSQEVSHDLQGEIDPNSLSHQKQKGRKVMICSLMAAAILITIVILIILLK